MTNEIFAPADNRAGTLQRDTVIRPGPDVGHIGEPRRWHVGRCGRAPIGNSSRCAQCDAELARGRDLGGINEACGGDALSIVVAAPAVHSPVRADRDAVERRRLSLDRLDVAKRRLRVCHAVEVVPRRVVRTDAVRRAESKLELHEPGRSGVAADADIDQTCSDRKIRDCRLVVRGRWAVIVVAPDTSQRAAGALVDHDRCVEV